MKLHLGCGSVRLDGWVNVDVDAPEADMHLDLRKPLPFDDASVDFIMNEHFIEHLLREEGLSLLRECRRVLRPGGVLRLSTPDLGFIATCYLTGKLGEWEGLWMPATLCRLMNEGMRSWGHQFVYDADELSAVLKEAGFQDVRFMPWRESDIPELAELEARPFHGELIVEASGEAPRSVSTMPASIPQGWRIRLMSAVRRVVR